MYGADAGTSEVVRIAGDDVFFRDELQSIGERLQPTEFAADAGRPKPVLDTGANLALGPDENKRRDGDERDEQAGGDDGDDNASQDSGQAELRQQLHHGNGPRVGFRPGQQDRGRC